MPLICGNYNLKVLISSVKCPDFYQYVNSMSNQNLKNSLFNIILTLKIGCLLPNYDLLFSVFFNHELFNNNIDRHEIFGRG